MSSQADNTPHSAPFLGPVDRESFFTAQIFYRRRTWLIAGLCFLGILVLGLPLSIITAPLLWSVVALGVDGINLLLPMPDLVTPVLQTVQQVLESADDRLPLEQLFPFILASLASGSLAALTIWFGVRRIIKRFGPLGIITALGAREPRTADLEERQLINLVEEMALAAELPVPRVMLVDLDIPNAAIFGNSPADAVLLVSRRLLDDCDRNTTQGAIAHLLGSAGNGDLGISLVVMSILLTLALVTNLSGMSVSRQTRGPTIAFLRRILIPGVGKGDGHVLIATLLLAQQPDIDDEPAGWSAGLRRVISIPFLLVALSFMTARSMVQLFLVGPLLALLWKQRKYLADATAVQLTRDADGLAKALAYLSARGAPLPGGQYLSHLFVVGAEAGQTRLQDEQHREMARVRQEIREGSWSDRLQSLGKAYTVSRKQAEVRPSASGQSGETQLGLAHALLPPIHERLKRLYRLGAQQGSHPAGSYPAAENERKWTVFTALAVVLVGLLVIALLIMVYAAVALSTLLGLGASMAIALLGTALLHPLLRMLAGGG